MYHALASDSNKQIQYAHSHLMDVSKGHFNDDVLACMLASHCFDEGSMPVRLGLMNHSYIEMLDTHFPGIELPESKADESYSLEESRQHEWGDLLELFLSHAKIRDKETQWIAEILATGCMSANHLWQDLGLWNRSDLSRMIADNFPSLSIKNDKNMKWKKFFYKQLCSQEGIYVCRSPTCETCADYQVCFSPED